MVTDVVVVHISFFGSPYANKDLDIYCLNKLLLLLVLKRKKIKFYF